MENRGDTEDGLQSRDFEIPWWALGPQKPEDSDRETATLPAADFAREQVRLFLFIGYKGRGSSYVSQSP